MSENVSKLSGVCLSLDTNSPVSAKPMLDDVYTSVKLESDLYGTLPDGTSCEAGLTCKS